MENKLTVNQQSMLDDVLEGLRKPQKQLPTKLFYDERGSELFEQITYLQEYYLTRTERTILQDNISEIAELAGPRVMVVELGSGSSSKTRLLLEKLHQLAAYIPVDISEEYLLKVVNQLRIEYPKISIIPEFADYTNSFEIPNLGDSYQRQLVFFPGSTIGNFKPETAQTFLQALANTTDDNSDMLIGVDLNKDPDILEKAYNDEQGLTAQFNKNILVHLNRELGSSFDVDAFVHNAFYNEEEGRIEMHLVAQHDQTITIAGEQITVEKGESIHTENSYKYSLYEFKKLVSDWYAVEKVWTDEQDYFALQYLRKK